MMLVAFGLAINPSSPRLRPAFRDERPAVRAGDHFLGLRMARLLVGGTPARAEKGYLRRRKNEPVQNVGQDDQKNQLDHFAFNLSYRVFTGDLDTTQLINP